MKAPLNLIANSYFYSNYFVRKLSLIFFIHIVFVTACFAQAAQYQVTLIGFYNLENLFDTINQPDVQDEEFTPEGANRYTRKVYFDKLGKLSQVIADMGTDDSPDGIAVLGVAEVENRSVLEDLMKTEKLKSRNYNIAHIDGFDERGVDVGMLYNPKYLKVTQMQSLHVPTEKLDSVYGFTRDVLYVSGELLGEPVHIFVNHWPSRRGGEELSKPYRALAASVCKQKVDSLIKINPHSKIVVMGDLNDNPVDESVTKVLNAKGTKSEVKPGGLYNPWGYLYKKGIGTLAYNDTWSLFDQIIISSAWLDSKQNGFFFKEARIFKREYMIQKTDRYKGYPKRTYVGSHYVGGYSDHFPTYVVMIKYVNK